MIDRFLALLDNYPANVLPRWQTLDRDLSTRYAFLVSRFSSMNLPDAKNTLLLKHILMQLSDIINDLQYYPSTMSRIQYLMAPDIRLKLEQRVDGLRTRTQWRDTFIRKTQKYTTELIIPVAYHKDPLMYYPTHPSEDHLWYHIKPLRLVYHDSPELVTDIVRDPKLRFGVYQPNIAVFTLNMVSLVLKYARYIDRCNIEGIEVDVKEFLRDEVMIHLFKDLRDVWVFNMIDRVFDCEGVVDITALSKSYSESRYTLSDYSQYMKELFKYIEFVKRGNVDPRFLLNTRLFANQSMVERLKSFREELRTWHLRQYSHYEMAIYIPYMRVMLMACKDTKATALKRSIHAEVYRLLLWVKRNNLHTQFNSPDIASWFENEFRFCELLLAEMR